MKKVIKAAAFVFPHVSIVISVMYIVFYCINSVNASMGFLDPEATPQTFILLLILSVSSLICSCILIYYARKLKRLEYEIEKAKTEKTPGDR